LELWGPSRTGVSTRCICCLNLASSTAKPFSRTNLVVLLPLHPLEHSINTTTADAFGDVLICDSVCNPGASLQTLQICMLGCWVKGFYMLGLYYFLVQFLCFAWWNNSFSLSLLALVQTSLLHLLMNSQESCLSFRHTTIMITLMVWTVLSSLTPNSFLC